MYCIWIIVLNERDHFVIRAATINLVIDLLRLNQQNFDNQLIFSVLFLQNAQNLIVLHTEM